VPEKYVRRKNLPLLLRHTGRTTLPEAPPFAAAGARTVCLHDAGLQSSVFEDLLAAIESGGGSALAFDLPGHGRSGSLDSLPSIEAMAEMARWVAGWCEIEQAILVGHGMGALIAIEWARAHPDSVIGIVLCGAGASLSVDDDMIEQMRQVTRGKAPRPFDPSRVCKESGPELMRRAYMEGIKTDPRATLVDLEASRAWADGFDRGDLSCPVRIVCGSAESENSRRRAEELESALDAASSCVIDGAAHFLPLEKPSALAAEIHAFGQHATETR
jgi:pimeloyl-ACP methyl ester carboxylesterase